VSERSAIDELLAEQRDDRRVAFTLLLAAAVHSARAGAA